MKKNLRQKSKEILAGISENQLQSKSKDLSMNLKVLIDSFASQDQLQTDFILGGFSSIQKEPHWYFEFESHGAIALPKIDENTMEFYLVENLDLLGSKIISFEDALASKKVIPDILIIPGLMFTIEGERLGRGGGFFDRYLENFTGLKIGVCFEEQICEELHTEDHDQEIDFLVTDKSIYKVKE